MRPIVYDAGVLIAADRSDRRMWLEHKLRLEAGLVPLVPAPVVAQTSRSPKQAELRRMLRGCDIVPFEEADAHRVGELLGRSGTRDIVDGAVVVLALTCNADIRTEDGDDIRHLVSVAGGAADVIGG